MQDGNHGEYRPRPDEFVDAGVAKFIRAADMANGRILFDSANSISPGALDRIRKGIGQPGDILFSHKGTVGKLAVAPLDAEPFVCSPQTTFWRCLDPRMLNPGFLYAFMRSPLFTRQWHVRKGDTDMADYVSLTAQRRLRIPVPGHAEQLRLGAAVSAFDDLIENNRRRVEILEEMARLIYREWFVHFRFPGHEDSELVDSDLGPIPDAWAVVPISAMADVVRGRSYRKHELVDQGGLPFVNLKCVDRGGGFRRDGLKRYDGPYRPEQLVSPGDIIVAVTDMTQARHVIGRAARVPILNEPRGVISLDLVRVVPQQGAAPQFLFGCLRYSDFGNQIKEFANGTNVLHLSADRISEFKTVAPPVDLQCAFADAVGPMYELSDTLELQNEVLREARDLLLPRLVSGELDVSELALELAEVG